MGGFGLVLVLFFVLFVGFFGMMKLLLCFGGWLNSVKVVLGFVEFVLVLKFFFNVDLVDYWGFFKIEFFLGLWIIIGIGLVFYLFGKIKFLYDSLIKKLLIGCLFLVVFIIVFVIYLVIGF